MLFSTHMVWELFEGGVYFIHCWSTRVVMMERSENWQTPVSEECIYSS